MEKNSQPVFVPLTNDLPALLSTSAVVSPLEAPPLHLLSHQRLAQGRGKFPRAGSSSLESTPLPLLWGFTQLPAPSCRFGGEGGAGSGAALSRRLSRKSREGPPGADLPRLERPAVPGLRNRVWLLYSCTGGERACSCQSGGRCSRRDTGCDTEQPCNEHRRRSNNGTTPPTWGRAAHVRKSNIAEITEI